MVQVPLLLPSAHGLLAHINQPGLGVAVREIADGCNCFVGVVLSQETGLLDTVALVDKLASLYPE